MKQTTLLWLLRFTLYELAVKRDNGELLVSARDCAERRRVSQLQPEVDRIHAKATHPDVVRAVLGHVDAQVPGVVCDQQHSPEETSLHEALQEADARFERVRPGAGDGNSGDESDDSYDAGNVHGTGAAYFY